MTEAKERVLAAALRLFAKNGYAATSTSDIARELGVTKGALYKHFASKRDIFDSVLARMEEHDAEKARENDLPEGALSEMESAYRAVSIDDIVEFAREMFRYWTGDEFASAFRKMLTIEQFRDPELGALYQRYLGAGPLGYTADLLASLGLSRPKERAVAFYAPMFLLFAIWDSGARAEATSALDAHLEEAREALKKDLSKRARNRR